MDRNENGLNKKLFLKRTLQFVFSISAFSIFLCYSSGFFIHPQTFNAYFSTFLFTLFTHTLERKYMFLICNGILAFLVKNSLIITTTSSHSHSDQLHASDYMVEYRKQQLTNDQDHQEIWTHQIVAPLTSFESHEEVSIMAEEQDDEYCEEKVSEAEEHKEDTLYIQNEACIADEKEIKLKGIYNDDDDDVDDKVDETTLATNEELVNTEELNRKFEEFIRKMKEEMRIEAQTQLISV